MFSSHSFHFHRKTQKTKRFSLVEVLVVIAVLSILLSLLSPSLNKTIQNIHQVRCSQNYKQLHLAIEAYVGDYTKYPLGMTNIAGTNRGGLMWDDLLALGYDGRDLPIQLLKRFNIYKDQIGTKVQRELYQCPIMMQSRTEGLRAQRTYAYNVCAKGTNILGFSNYWENAKRWSAGIHEVPAPAETILLLEIAWGAMSAAGGGGASNYNVQHPQRGVHFGEYNYLFADGHSETMLREDTGWKEFYGPGIQVIKQSSFSQ